MGQKCATLERAYIFYKSKNTYWSKQIRRLTLPTKNATQDSISRRVVCRMKWSTFFTLLLRQNSTVHQCSAVQCSAVRWSHYSIFSVFDEHSVFFIKTSLRFFVLRHYNRSGVIIFSHHQLSCSRPGNPVEDKMKIRINTKRHTTQWFKFRSVG